MQLLFKMRSIARRVAIPFRHVGGQTRNNAMVSPVALLAQLLVRFLYIIGHQDRLTYPRVDDNLSVNVFAATGILQRGLSEEMYERRRALTLAKSWNHNRNSTGHRAVVRI